MENEKTKLHITTIRPHRKSEGGIALIELVLDGDTYDKKDKIKAAGYVWELVIGDNWSDKKTAKRWHKVVEFKSSVIKNEIKLAKEAGAVSKQVNITPWDYDNLMVRDC